MMWIEDSESECEVSAMGMGRVGALISVQLFGVFLITAKVFFLRFGPQPAPCNEGLNTFLHTLLMSRCHSSWVDALLALWIRSPTAFPSVFQKRGRDIIPME